MSNYIFGANILENLTTGMYQDSKVIYREYIQNACDQIDKAVNDRILKQGEGTIDIWPDRDLRTIVIEDNSGNFLFQILVNFLRFLYQLRFIAKQRKDCDFDRCHLWLEC